MKGKLILGENNSFDMDNELGINSHVCVFGGSGTGKSHSIVKPNILNFAEEGSSMIISDPKGALEKEFVGYLREKNYKIYSIDLIHPERSTCTYNILDNISREMDFVKLAHRIVYSDPMTRKSTHQDPFWLHQSEIVLSCMLELVFMVEPEGEETLDKVIHYVSNLTIDESCITYRLLEKILSEKRDSLAAKQWIKIKNMMAAEKTFSCVIASVQEHLGRYEGEEMTEFFNKKKRIEFEKFPTEKSVLFLKISDSDSTYYNYANIIYGQALDTMCSCADEFPDGKCPIPIRIIMDDFGTNSFVEEMPQIISTARARNISFMLICQSVQQLRLGYGDDAQTIISNCDNLIFMGSNDVETAKEFSTRLDIPVVDILSQKRGKLYIFRAGEKPIEDCRYDYRKHKAYLQLKGSINTR